MDVTPRLKIRAVRLEAVTPVGTFGRTVTFDVGLNIIRADNSSGKSTLLQAIIYALGLEGMLSAQREIPLPHVMTERLNTGTRETPVQQSAVMLEIENQAQDIVTIIRYVKHPKIRDKLVRVSHGAGLTGDGTSGSRDYFVRRPGAAQREAGFHNFLEQFIGWRLPMVPRFDGSEGPLYMETLFPYFYVEQKHGWSGIQARIPTYLGIRDVAKRTAEYVLDLEVFRRIIARQRILSSLSELDSDWRSAHRELLELTKATGVGLAKPPQRISDSLDESTAEPIVLLNDRWISMRAAENKLSEELASITSQPVRTVGQSAAQAERELEIEERAVRTLLASLSALSENRDELQKRANQLELRIEALREDLQRHKDAKILVGLGSDYATELFFEHVCPTCHQDVHDGLDITSHAMSVDENIDFIDRELKTFEAAQEDTVRLLDTVNIQERALRDELVNHRRQVRALRESLSTSENAPSIADIRRRVTLEDKLEAIRGGARTLENLRMQLSNIATRHAQQRAQLESNGTSTLEQSDAAKISALQEHVRRQLRRYNFNSLPPDEIEISPETYRPAHEGFDLGFDLSASDNIRMIWSYLLGMLRVSAETGGNHLNLLILDEPRQQETAPESYRQLLQQAAEQGVLGEQIIFATSESLDRLGEMLGAAKVNVHHLPPGEKLLVPSDTRIMT